MLKKYSKKAKYTFYYYPIKVITIKALTLKDYIKIS
jgi:hypothetical protein